MTPPSVFFFTVWTNRLTHNFLMQNPMHPAHPTHPTQASDDYSGQFRKLFEDAVKAEAEKIKGAWYQEIASLKRERDQANDEVSNLRMKNAKLQLDNVNNHKIVEMKLKLQSIKSDVQSVYDTLHALSDISPASSTTTSVDKPSPISRLSIPVAHKSAPRAYHHQDKPMFPNSLSVLIEHPVPTPKPHPQVVVVAPQPHPFPSLPSPDAQQPQPMSVSLSLPLPPVDTAAVPPHPPKKRGRIHGVYCEHNSHCGHLYTDKYLKYRPYMVLHKRARTPEAINLMDCRLTNINLVQQDFEMFCDGMHLDDEDKRAVLKHSVNMVVAQVPVKEVSGSCVVCKNECKEGMSGLCDSHVICVKCFGIYLKVSGEHTGDTFWAAKPRFLKCPGSLIGEACN